MNFEDRLRKITPRLKKIARYHKALGFFIDEDDLYQEMCAYLWNSFRDGVPGNLNDAYIVKGCEFYILNYLRMKREKAMVVSLEKPLNGSGWTLKDILPDTKEPLANYVDRKMTINEIRNNGITEREKEVFSFIIKGYTTREIGKELGISHVMVVKYKQKIIKNWRKKIK